MLKIIQLEIYGVLKLGNSQFEKEEDAPIAEFGG